MTYVFFSVQLIIFLLLWSFKKVHSELKVIKVDDFSSFVCVWPNRLAPNDTEMWVFSSIWKSY